MYKLSIPLAILCAIVI